MGVRAGGSVGRGLGGDSVSGVRGIGCMGGVGGGVGHVRCGRRVRRVRHAARTRPVAKPNMASVLRLVVELEAPEHHGSETTAAAAAAAAAAAPAAITGRPAAIEAPPP